VWNKLKSMQSNSSVISHWFVELGTECNPKYRNDTCTEKRIQAGNGSVCTVEAEVLICYP